MSFDICSPSPLPNRLFVEASAGTGKTFLIEHYVVRAALGEFDPKRLALVTFTKAVAREVRLRLQRTLERTHQRLIDGECDGAPEYLQPILEQESFFRRRLARTVEEVTNRLSEATISTIHGFCDHLLRASGEEGNGEWVSAEEQKAWLEEFIQEGGGLTLAEFEALSKRYRFEQDTLLDILMELMNEAPGGPDTAWEEAKEAAARVAADAPAIAAALEAKARAYCGTTLKDGSFKPKLKKAFAAIQKCVEDGVEEQTLEPCFGFSLAECFSKPLKRLPLVPNECERIAQNILSDLWPALEQLTDMKCIIKRLGGRCAKAFHEFLSRCGGKTPETVVRRVLALSTQRSFVAMAAKAVGWLIVDEFQDTDQIQYQIFSNLFLNNPDWEGRVLFVGDPKQAIYGFRKADVYSYLAAKKSAASGEVKTLSVNFRADPLVVEAQNQLFAGPAHPHIFFLPKTQSHIAVEPSQSGKKVHEPLGDGRGAVHLPVCHGSLGRKRLWPHAELENGLLFPWVADEMICLNRLGVPFSQQAVLVRDKHQAERVQRFLGTRHIPTCAWKIDSVVESPIFSWLQKALLLALRPADQRRLASLLLAIPSPYHLDLCRAMASERRLDEWALCATAWKAVQEAFFRRGIGAMARAVFTSLWDGRQTVDEWLAASPQQLTDLEHLFELLAMLEQRLPRSIEAYIDALRDLPRFFSDEPEALTRRTDPDDEGVPILTMHRSKGLEFDVVYALGGASRTPFAEEEAQEEADAEKLRQLYVAVTRAKRRCYLPLLIEDEQRPVARAAASPAELLFASLSCPSSSDARYAAMNRLFEQASGLAAESSAITISDVRLEQRGYTADRPSPEASAATPYPVVRYAARTYESFSSSHADEARPLLHKTSRPIGTSFHAAIAKLLFAPASSRASPEAVSAWLGAKDPELAALLFSASRLFLPLQGRQVCLEDVPRADMRVECGFLEAKASGSFVRGILDLVFVWKGEVYIVDWKTHEGSDLPLEAIVSSTYDLQRQIYQKAVAEAFAGSYRLGGCFFVFVRQLPNGIVTAFPPDFC